MPLKKSKRSKTKRFSSTFFSLSSLLLLFLFIKNPNIASKAVSDALKTCVKLLIPSLFPLMIASEITLKCGIIDKLMHPLVLPISKIFGIKKEASAPIFLGLLGGYTTSVGGALALYKDNRISKNDCEKIISLSSLPSLSFLTGFVGGGIFQNSTVGWILWGACIISMIILGYIFNKFSPSNHSYTNKNSQAFSFVSPTDAIPYSKSTLSPSKIIVDAIGNSANSMLRICACVVFFSTLIATLKYPLDALSIAKEVQVLLLGAFEITNGVSNIEIIESELMRSIICAFFVGWSGLSVHFQIIAICDGCNLSFKRYFLYKALQGIICSILIALILLFKS